MAGCLTLGLGCVWPFPAGAANVPKQASSAVQSAYRRPLAFVENRGQYDGQVKYVLRGAQGTVFFTAGEVVFSFVRKNTPAARRGSRKEDGPGTEEERQDCSRLDFRFRFDGAADQPEVVGEGELPGKINRLSGSGENQVSGIPLFGELAYRHLYPGTDIRFRTENGNLRYAITLQDDADIDRLRLVYEGVDGVRVNEEGSLVVSTSLGDFVEPPPTVRRGGSEQKICFKITGATTVGFAPVSPSDLPVKMNARRVP